MVDGPIYAVRDFLDFTFSRVSFVFPWATFNFADSYLVVGAIMLGVYSFFAPDAKREVAIASSLKQTAPNA
jgi:lipoprotein signal peptidase